MNEVIRKAELKDVESIIDLHYPSFVKAHVSKEYDIAEEDIKSHFGSKEQQLEKYIKYLSDPEHNYWILEIDGVVRGYAASYMKKKTNFLVQFTCTQILLERGMAVI